MNAENPCAVCGHPEIEHGRHDAFVPIPEGDKREVCLECPGYTLEINGVEVDGYPRGKAWHRFKPMFREAAT